MIKMSLNKYDIVLGNSCHCVTKLINLYFAAKDAATEAAFRAATESDKKDS